MEVKLEAVEPLEKEVSVSVTLIVCTPKEVDGCNKVKEPFSSTMYTCKPLEKEKHNN